MWTRLILGALGAASFALTASQASSATTFGSKLNHQLTPAETCISTPTPNQRALLCSWVLTQAQNNAGNEQAPHDGTIIKLRLMACGPGTFVLQIARAQPGQDKARVIRTGPLINYVGKPRNCNATSGFFIESFDVNVPVQEGDYLSVVASRVSFIYNSSGDGSHVFEPPLPDGGPFRTASENTGSGFLMLQAVMNP